MIKISKLRITLLQEKAVKFVIVAIALIFELSLCNASKPAIDPSDGNGAYATGQYRNLFLENGHSQKEISEKVEKAFQQLFHGDSSQTIYFKSGSNANGPLAYLSDVLHSDVRSEGMSYGMMVCVQLDKKEEFDAMWNWALTYMYNRSPEHPSQGYFSWSIKTDGTPNAETAAPDGEEYFATALYFAANRWGNGEGIYNYKAYADSILVAMLHRDIKKGKTKFGPKTVGPMFNEKVHMVLFVPDEGANDFTDPSYHLPAFYELWARWGPENDRKFWASCADTSRKYFVKATHPKTGLCSDYANFDGSPHSVIWNANSANFSFDSWRTASNWAVDWSWFQKDSNEIILSNRIQAFFASDGIHSYGSQFEVSGKKLDNMHRTGLIAANATASLSATNKIAKEFVEEFWNTPVPSAFDDRYYGGTLYLLNILHCSGEFKIWKPGMK